MILDVGCNAAESIFLPNTWENLSVEEQTIIKNQVGLPCNGVKAVGLYCLPCHYCTKKEIKE